MVNFYVNLIENGKINSKTGEPWKLEDVPAKWREDVRKALENE